MKLLGLDIGTNSVGSAWVDTEQHTIKMGVSVFPAGVEERDDRRGAPKNQARRTYRSQRRSIARRAQRRHEMRTWLLESGWMPTDENAYQQWVQLNPWMLRAEGLCRPLSASEFGRILLHMAQRRGAYGFDVEEDDQDAGKIKEAIDHTRQTMREQDARTFGELMAIIYRERRKAVGHKGREAHLPIRNRTNAAKEPIYEFCADRDLIHEEFQALWNKQRSFDGELARQLTDERLRQLDENRGDETWRTKGMLFGQRNTYWNAGVLGRCDLEPTDMGCPRIDVHAQEFLVIETVNNIRIIPPGQARRPLDVDERRAVVDLLRRQKTASPATVRKALGIHKGPAKTQYSLSLDADPKRGLNTDWFYREVICHAVGPSTWASITDKQKDSINRAILKLDPKQPDHHTRFQKGCHDWWGLDEGQTQRLITVWESRPNPNIRLQLSRRAIRNLLPYMCDEGVTVNEARKRFAEDADNGATPEQRSRYGFAGTRPSGAIRRFQQKHPNLLPPAPQTLSNPVVRKAIHEVRRHVQAYLRRFGRPDRVVIELAREAKLPAKVRNDQLAANRTREKKRNEIIAQFGLGGLTRTQQEKAVKRVLLCQEQGQQCAYCGNGNNTITEKAAAEGIEVELDHIIPESRGGGSGLNNLVLCHTRCNRGKTNRTPKEWLSKEQFAKLEQRLSHLKKSNPVKWDNLHKEVSDITAFAESQLTDTAYASRQVADWLRKALYGDETDGNRCIFTTKGRYTPWLRRDWGLYATGGTKNRGDHREHALDAMVVALSGPERLQDLAHAVQAFELSSSEGMTAPKREALPPPWSDAETFRDQVMDEFSRLLVAHRPAQRKITGSLHNDTIYGPVLDSDGRLTRYATIKRFAIELTPKHLRVPKGWDELRRQLETAPNTTARRTLRRRMLALEDVKPEKSGVVRDRWFREELRQCLRENGLDPDHFTPKQMKELVLNKGICLGSGAPVRRITLLRAPSVVEIRRKQWDDRAGRKVYDDRPQTIRLYEPQNNHHIEIRENARGKWIVAREQGVVTTYEAANRVRPSKASGRSPQPAVSRHDTAEGRFIMSLSIGEMVRMRHPKTRTLDYFVVFMIDGIKKQIHFTPHWDAGRSQQTDQTPVREDISLSPGQLQQLGESAQNTPQKVWVGPLGGWRELRRD
ncbi:MAG: type II CRISPR RNA-guided endonuclease Cas9 [Phycisphaerae bacterium]|nr:type II CRISPR RNA-guided endonuclease Cas9 [Phycisphaerae bacterium]